VVSLARSDRSLSDHKGKWIGEDQQVCVYFCILPVVHGDDEEGGEEDDNHNHNHNHNDHDNGHYLLEPTASQRHRHGKM
jgi:hypothetical protein